MNSRGFVIAGSILLLLLTVLMRVRDDRPGAADAPFTGAGGPTTSRDDLARTVDTMTSRLNEDPGDAAAAVALSDALLRQSRVANDPALPVVAERALRRSLTIASGDYAAQRMLATVLLAQHRFREAIVEATKAKTIRPDDAWNDGVMGDAHLELGEYDEAFAAFDRMMSIRPSAAAYARVSYARELQGDRDAAAALMKMSLDATSAQDQESHAWHEAQLGHLAFDAGALADAKRHFERAEFLFPQYPLAAEGLVQVMIAERNLEPALAFARERFAVHRTAPLATQVGDVARALGRREEAEQHYKLAEDLLRYEPSALATFLADRGRNLPRAVQLAEGAVTVRQDIFTFDALAWTLFKAGRTREAFEACQRALRTGTSDRRILAHAAAIHRANGDLSAARRLAARALEGHEHFDLARTDPARQSLLN